MIPKPSDVGVIVGRFQVHRLHEAHRQLIQSVYDTHRQTVIVLGLSPVKVSHRNPLDFEARKQMVLDAFPHATVLYIKDQRNDARWSASLDALIKDVTTPTQEVRLYGGRDSFIARYWGDFKTEALEPETFLSGTEMRKGIAKGVKASEDFRAGVIWASANGYPKTFPTVDVAIYRDVPMEPTINDGPSPAISHREWLLVRKPEEADWRFCGGFVDPTKDESLERAVKREVAEETGCEIGTPTYVTSALVDDWRYKHETDKILTAFFTAPFIFGPVRPADDVAEAKWFKDSEMTEDLFVPEHVPLLVALKPAPLAGRTR